MAPRAKATGSRARSKPASKPEAEAAAPAEGGPAQTSADQTAGAVEPATGTEPAEKPVEPAGAVTGDAAPPSVEPGGDAAPPASAGPPADLAEFTLHVVGPKGGFWRAGRRFGPEQVTLTDDDISADQARAIIDEPRLTVVIEGDPDTIG